MALLRTLYKKKIPVDSLLVSKDIEALYCSIPHSLGLSVVESFLSESDAMVGPYNAFIIQLLQHILTKNVFLFDGSHYLQVQGVTMGTCCAPSYANPYLGGWERTLFSNSSLSIYLANIICWHRDIDDIFMVWNLGVDDLKIFMNKLAENNFNLKFTMEYDQRSLAFLDITILKQEDGTIDTLLFRKPTAGNTILHAISSHPQPLTRSIPYSQYLRLR